jgi:hypothetical protein
VGKLGVADGLLVAALYVGKDTERVGNVAVAVAVCVGAEVDREAVVERVADTLSVAPSETVSELTPDHDMVGTEGVAVDEAVGFDRVSDPVPNDTDKERVIHDTVADRVRDAEGDGVTPDAVAVAAEAVTVGCDPEADGDGDGADTESVAVRRDGLRETVTDVDSVR